MVAAHISDLFRRSKACMHGLSILMRCKWDNEIHSRASSLLNLMDIHSKTVASTVNKEEPLEAHLMHAPLWKETSSCFRGKEYSKCSSCKCSKPREPFAEQCIDLFNSRVSVKFEKNSKCSDVAKCKMDKGIASFPTVPTDLANFLTNDKRIGFSCSAQVVCKANTG
ncbi:hypothetical protein ACH5RR_034394 [Cinchona calisaya]|uniref:Uncharacterized protein n=1 Tax=Cinchona calisaya TaxID=153742 RepID=A0ABD2YAS3_9GENT